MKETVQLTGEPELWDALSRLPKLVRDKVLKRALTAAAKPIVASAQAHCDKDTGTLRDSIEYKLTSKGTRGESALVIIGPARNRAFFLRVRTRGKNKGEGVFAFPTKYASAIEFGHRIVVGKKEVGEVRPRPFMRPAWDEQGGESAVYTFADAAMKEIDAGIAAIASKVK